MKGRVEESVEPVLPSVYVAAHELKAPLILMRQLSLELQQGGGDVDTLERLVLSVERSLRLVEQLTRTSRLDDALFASEPLQAEAICQSVAHELTPFARQHNQTIVTCVSRRSCLAVGQHSLLTALLVNLCDNALTHNPPGRSIILSARQRADTVVFSVRDFGPQISQGAFNTLKRQLGKGPQPVGDRPRSSGLGLWIAGQFAHAMRGELTMTRHHAAGITVSVSLPHSKQLSLL